LPKAAKFLAVLSTNQKATDTKTINAKTWIVVDLYRVSPSSIPNLNFSTGSLPELIKNQSI
jgi:hypothetical protein